MRRSLATIEAITLEPAAVPAARLACDPAAIPAPGQASLALVPGVRQPLRVPLFPTRVTADGFTTDRLPDPAWQPGNTVDLLGPLGRAFAPPAGARRWLLIAFQRPFLHLLPLVDRGLAAGASVAVFAERDLPPLSPEVEVVQDVRDALAWADFLAIEAPASDIGTLRKLTGAAGRVPLPAQILVETELACGLGVCGACSVKARRGWKLACRDGPVFDLNMLDW